MTLPSVPSAGRRGSALFLSLLAVLILSVLAVPVMVRLTSNNRLTEKDYRELAALSLAEAGVERAIWELNFGSIASWPGDANLRTLSLASVAAAGGTVVGDVSVQIADPSSDHPVVTSTGRVPWTGALFVDRKVRVVLKRGFKSYFDFGIFGDEGFDMHGNAYTDSYISTDGPYDPLSYRSLGNIGTNAFHHWDVVLLNNTIIHGDAITGYASDPEYVIQLRNAAEITGQKTSLNAPKPLPPAVAPVLSLRGDFASATGSLDTVITQSGEYSSFVLASNSKVTISGNVTLFVDGDFLMNANSVLEITPGSTVEIIMGNGRFQQDSNTSVNNLTQDPKALAILGTADFQEMIWRANSGFYGVVYVPEANVDYAANGDFFGSLVCNYLSMSSESGIHYDESLGSWDKYGTISNTFIVQSWQPWD